VKRLVLVIALALAACGTGEAAGPGDSRATVPDIGVLPDLLTGSTVAAPVTAAPTTTVTTVASTPLAAPTTESTSSIDEGRIGRAIDGNRVLVIGDSIFESISTRFGGQLCARLVPLGWAVEVQAENGEDVEFGLSVLDQRLAAGWDAAAVMLGNNYRDDPADFGAKLEQIVERLAPRPTLLFNVTQFDTSRAEVNYVVRSVADRHEHVTFVDWGARTSDADDLLGADGLHLSDLGRVVLADVVADQLDVVDGTGTCLPAPPIEDVLSTDTG